MDVQETFGVVIRTIGLIISLLGICYVLSSLAVFVHPSKSHITPLHYLCDGVFCLLLSLYFLRGAPALIRFCYPNSKRMKKPDNE